MPAFYPLPRCHFYRIRRFHSGRFNIVFMRKSVLSSCGAPRRMNFPQSVAHSGLLPLFSGQRKKPSAFPGLQGNQGTVTVKTPGGTLTSNKPFRVTPVILSFTPTSGKVGTSVTTKGNSLTQTKAVTFGGVKATNFSVKSDTRQWQRFQPAPRPARSESLRLEAQRSAPEFSRSQSKVRVQSRQEYSGGRKGSSISFANAATMFGFLMELFDASLFEE
jgi:hypothetical protein